MAPSNSSSSKPTSQLARGLLKTMKSLRAGTSSLPPAVPNNIAGQPMTVAQIDQTLDTGIALFGAVDAAKALEVDALLARNAQAAMLKLFCENFIHYLRGALGKDDPQLAKFGLVTRARQKPSPGKTVKANVQRAATREVRHVMGKNQRAEIPAATITEPVTVAADGTVTPAATPAETPSAAAETPQAATPAKNPGSGSK